VLVDVQETSLNSDIPETVMVDQDADSFNVPEPRRMSPSLVVAKHSDDDRQATDVIPSSLEEKLSVVHVPPLQTASSVEYDPELERPTTHSFVSGQAMPVSMPIPGIDDREVHDAPLVVVSTTVDGPALGSLPVPVE
jgi:hypothetical protein